MIAVDTSVAVAGFGDWHELHHEAAAVLDRGPSLPAHVLLETYSVLTGFPPPHRADSRLVLRWLEARFPDVLPAPDAPTHRDLVRVLAEVGRGGGAVYDGLVAMTVKAAGGILVTADDRARPVYDLCGVQVRSLLT